MLGGSLTQGFASVRSVVVLCTVIFCALFLAVNPAHAQTTTYSNTTTAAIPESTTCASTLTRTFVVGTSYTIADVNVGAIITHNLRNHLRLSLTSPAGTTVNLMTNIGGTRSHLNVLYDDAAAASITTHSANSDNTGTAPYQRTFKPQSVLSVFNGQNSLGTWTLTMCDSVAGTTGSFVRADLYLTTPSADLSLTKTSNVATQVTGGSVIYTLTVTNATTSASTATGIIVRDVLPSGVSYVSASGTGTYTSGTGSWAVGSLAPGTSASIAITTNVAAVGGTVTNSAEIIASSVPDIDSTVNNGVTAEDDYSAASFSVTRTAGTPPTISCPVGSNTFDWAANVWTPGSLNNSYTLAGVGAFNIAMTTVTPYVAGSPAITNQLTGGVAGEVSLFQNLNNTALADTATTVITMPGGLPGMQFRLFDVDFGAASFSDKITVTGSYLGSTVIPVLTNGVSNYVSGNVAIGDVGAVDTTADGTVVVTFNAAVDTVTIVYGNHTTAPADPGNQWVGLGDMTFCSPYSSYTVSKISQVLSDGISTTNPKAIPGATVRYCITFSNTGASSMTSVSSVDNLPAAVSYVPGTMRSGSSCGAAATVEDDDASGTDESDPFGMNISGSTVTGTAVTLAGSSSFAMIFSVLVN
jgi:uncharacterized repeat protein (TIGR01451 family)